MMTTDTMPIHTTEIGFPWAKPVPHTSRHLTWHARARRARNRFLASSFMDDVRNRTVRALIALGAFTTAFSAFLVLRALWYLAAELGIDVARWSYFAHACLVVAVCALVGWAFSAGWDAVKEALR